MTAAATRYERHTLLHINAAGRERVFAELAGKGYGKDALGEMLLPERFPSSGGALRAVPGIARREDFSPRQGFVPLGFVSWRADESGRFRVASFVRPDEIIAASSPEEVAGKADGLDAARAERTPCLAALAHLRREWPEPLRAAFRLGVWGSAALEIETGLAYTHQWSDLDVRLLAVRPVERGALAACLDVILAAEAAYGIRIDAELLALGEYGISLKELLREGVTVLGKGLSEVVLLQKSEVFARLAGTPAQD